MQVTTIGLDLAKNVFQVHGVTEDGTVAFNRSLRRAQMFAFFERLEPCLVGMEACGSSQYWARELSKFGHDVNGTWSILDPSTATRCLPGAGRMN